MDFKIAPISVGPDSNNWYLVSDLLNEANIVIEPNAKFSRYSKVIKNGDGLRVGLGYPVVTWNFSALTGPQRQALRDICPGLSAQVYISTLSDSFSVDGEREWIEASAIMHWTEDPDDLEGENTLDLQITFTHVVEL